MMTQADTLHAPPTTSALRTVVIVGNEPDERVLETVAEAGDYDVVFVAPMTRAYSQIKRVAPNMVIVCLSFDDLDAFQVMSMLKLDRDTSSIPVVTCLLEAGAAAVNGDG